MNHFLILCYYWLLIEATNNNTILGSDSFIALTMFAVATTNKATTKETIELRFLFGIYSSVPVTFIVPRILVFSRTAYVMVKTRRKGRITSKSPKSLKNSTAFPNGVAIILVVPHRSWVLQPCLSQLHHQQP